VDPSVSGDERPDVIPSAVDPDVECVRIGSMAHPETTAAPPDEAQQQDGPCPPGYVPRRRRRKYQSDGKDLVTGEPPERNPEPRF
jgi:hypothetical protein